MNVERRKYERLPVDCKLKISKLYKQNIERVELIDADINVIDISKGGIGFRSRSVIPVGCYFDATIGLDEKEYFRSVVKVVRCVEDDEGFFYGAEFVGLAGFLAHKVEIYAQKIKEQREDTNN